VVSAQKCSIPDKWIWLKTCASFFMLPSTDFCVWFAGRLPFGWFRKWMFSRLEG
jgi:hypothetical protein